MFEPIGIVHCGFKEKFGIPRQPGLATSIQSRIELLPPFNTPAAVKGLEECSHIWLIFLFSANQQQGWSPTVRPPRLGGNQRIGVFASRSPFRPNPIGLSVVKLEEIITTNGVTLVVTGADLLDTTPILDIKPYLPYADVIADAHFALAPDYTPNLTKVNFSAQADTVCQSAAQEGMALRQQITELLRQDPRPAYHQKPEREYGMQFDQYNIRWRVREQQVEVIYIDKTPGCPLGEQGKKL